MPYKLLADIVNRYSTKPKEVVYLIFNWINIYFRNSIIISKNIVIQS
nr:MAG TPA: hypothetical protein [Caudoviricetes sp.]